MSKLSHETILDFRQKVTQSHTVETTTEYFDSHKFIILLNSQSVSQIYCVTNINSSALPILYPSILVY